MSKLIIGINDLKTTHPDLCKEWHPIKNGELEPYNVSPFSKKKVWWLCEKQHEWQAEIKSRQYGCGCPYCADYGPASKVIIGENDLTTTHPTIAAEWHPTKNGNLTPNMIHPGSNEKVWWRCRKCNYEWRTSIVERTGPDKTGCPQCAAGLGAKKRKQTLIQQKGSLVETNPELIEEWDWEKNIGVAPDQITAGSGRKIWWKCANNHEWQSTINHRVKGRKCPYCTNRRIIPGYNDFASKYPELVKEWDYQKNKNLDPTKIAPHSGKKAWWVCKKCGYKWESVIASRAYGVGCPDCAHINHFGRKLTKKVPQS